MAHYTWKAPLRGQFKVNVHVLHNPRQHNGNNNGVGIVIRDHRGRLVRGLIGTIRGLSPLATQLWALHMGLNQARLCNCELIMLETNNFAPYFEVKRQDGRGDRICRWIVEQIVKQLGYNPEWENSFKYISESDNRAAHYLAAVGVNNWPTMHFFFEPFGRLQEKLDLDMGFGPPIPQLQVSPIPMDAQGLVVGFAPVAATIPVIHNEVVQDQVSDNGGGI